MPRTWTSFGLIFSTIIGGSPFLAAPVWAEDPAKELRVVDRQPLSLCVYYPQKKGRYASSTDMLKFVSVAASNTTDLEPRSLTDAEITECAALTTPVKCFVERIDATQRARRAAAAAGDDDDRSRRDLLLVVAARPSDDGDEELVSAALIDVGTAIDLIDKMSNRAPDEVEAKIIERALLARPEPAKVGTSEDASQFIIRLFERDFRDALEKTKHWQPYGMVDIKTNVGPLSVTVNDTIQAGVTAPAGITRLKGVRLGNNKIGLSGNDDVRPWEQTVEVKSNEITLVTPVFEAAPNSLIPVSNLAVELFGGALFAVGTAFLVHGILADPAGKEVCFSNAGACLTDPLWTRFGYANDADEVDLQRSPNGGGPAIAPLGYSMMGAGLVMGLGTLLFGDDENLPWIQVVAGLALGVTAYTVSEALDNKSNFP